MGVIYKEAARVCASGALMEAAQAGFGICHPHASPFETKAVTFLVLDNRYTSPQLFC